MTLARPARRRIAALVLLGGAIASGLGVHFGMPDGSFSDIAGDALYALAVYLFVVLVAPGWRPLGVGAVAFAWCASVELFQLTGLPSQLGAGFPPLSLVLGTGFDLRDLFVYAIAVVGAVAVDAGGSTVRKSSGLTRRDPRS